MGDFLSGALGTKNNYQASNPYSSAYLDEQIGHQNQLYGQQQDLAQMLKAQAEGNGPNPAQTQYMQNVQQNIANAQGLLSSQRGLNPALASKMGGKRCRSIRATGCFRECPSTAKATVSINSSAWWPLRSNAAGKSWRTRHVQPSKPWRTRS
jgi:hypothetical protein